MRWTSDACFSTFGAGLAGKSRSSRRPACPFFASLGFCSVERAPRKLATVPERPALIFDQYFVNLSDLHNAARVEAWFHFKNGGKAPAKITKLEPSCGCLDPKVEKRAYMPGEECEFPLGVLMTREKPGPHDHSASKSITRIEHLCLGHDRLQSRRPPGGHGPSVPAAVLAGWSMFVETKQSIMITDMRPIPFHVRGRCASRPT